MVFFLFVCVPAHGYTFENFGSNSTWSIYDQKAMASESTGQESNWTVGAWIVLPTESGKHTKFKESSRQKSYIFPSHLLGGWTGIWFHIKVIWVQWGCTDVADIRAQLLQQCHRIFSLRRKPLVLPSANLRNAAAGNLPQLTVFSFLASAVALQHLPRTRPNDWVLAPLELPWSSAKEAPNHFGNGGHKVE